MEFLVTLIVCYVYYLIIWTYCKKGLKKVGVDVNAMKRKKAPRKKKPATAK